ncbi:SGNH/GDSL hydrolase family protein [Nitrosococcus wardiae]|uniref:SGNH/GDSL hydrolase family protein n=1 Tax=Nitrosococcus wardiae TaxID=1814290 RepID=A0A4P7C0Y5_9GAMM|nr:SGNH/GDSL hydrolase family protein [Nitrosococcus wardiae]QBQ55084.1 SGNH/GDSL hydrolase family protein [Nitrosococcus wardiae]
MSRARTITFSLFPVLLLLVILEITGRVIYPFDIDARAMIKAERDPRIRLSYLSRSGDGKSILFDVHRQPQRYIPFLGWIGAPNTDLPTISTNSLGFRDDPIEPRQTDERRVLILGGSTAWGLGASANEYTVTGVMESLLNQGTQAYNYRVMNGAYPGWQSRNELIALMEFYNRFDPDYVIVLTGYNDLFTLTHGNDGELHTRPESRMLANAVDESLKPMTTIRALRKVAGSLGIWRIVIHFREKMTLAKPHDGVTRYNAETSSKVASDILDRYLAMADYTQRHGSQLIIALQPDIYTTEKAMTGEELGVRRRVTEGWRDIETTYGKYRADLHQLLTENLIAAGIPVIDLAGAFDGVQAPVFIDACHLNDEGYYDLGVFLFKQVGDHLTAMR